MEDNDLFIIYSEAQQVYASSLKFRRGVVQIEKIMLQGWGINVETYIFCGDEF